MTVALSLPEQSPAGVVSGIYDGAGALVSQAVISQWATPTLYVAQPSLAGTYRVGAEVAGVATGQSAVQTVTAADQGLRLYQASNRPKVVAGKGMNSYAWELRVQRLVNGVVTGGADSGG